MNILNSIGAGIATVGLFIASLFGYAPAEAPSDSLGVALPSGTANFETALATGITDTATTMTLTSVAVRGGTTLSGYQCFTIDEGSAQAEFVCGTASSTSVTSLERGISPADGVTEDADLKFSHRRGASIKITDFPLLQRIKSQASGSGTYESVLQYSSSVSTGTVASNGQNIASVAYVNALSFGGVAASASSSVAGFVELATGGEAASTTIFGSTGAMLALHTGISTSSAPSTGNVVVVTQDDGNIDSGYLGSDSGTNRIVFDSNGTYTKSARTKYIFVEVWAGGGSGGSRADTEEAGGGGGGGYISGFIASSSLSATTSVFVGDGGVAVSGNANGNAGASSTFSTLVAWGGNYGCSGGTGAAGGAGGGASATSTVCASATQGDAVDILGGTGGGGGGSHGSSTYGGGGGGGSLNSTAVGGGGRGVFGGGGGGGCAGGVAGIAGTSQFGGAGGVGCGGNGATPGGGGGGSNSGSLSGAGGKGRIIITEYF